MPLLRAVPVVMSAGERAALKKRVRGAKTAHRDRLRALIVLAAARGRDNARIAADLQITVDTVRKWRRRFAVRGLGGLADLPRPGRPRRIGELDRAAVVALACQLPAATGVPLAHWTGPELAAELAVRGLARPMSASSVLRILAEHPVKPWQYQSWIYPRDPDFEARAKIIVDLYQGCYQGQPLGPGDRILSFDAKPQINARRRLHPTVPAAPGRPVRYEHEYKRKGSLARWPAWTCTPARYSPPPRSPPGSGRSWISPARSWPIRSTRTRPGSSSSWTTAQTTAARPPSNGSPKRTRTRS